MNFLFGAAGCFRLTLFSVFSGPEIRCPRVHPPLFPKLFPVHSCSLVENVIKKTLDTRYAHYYWFITSRSTQCPEQGCVCVHGSFTSRTPVGSFYLSVFVRPSLMMTVRNLASNFCFFETGLCYVVQAALELLLPQPQVPGIIGVR